MSAVGVVRNYFQAVVRASYGNYSFDKIQENSIRDIAHQTVKLYHI